MSRSDKEIFWLHGEIQTPPFTREARIEAGYLLRLLQKGEKLSMPQSRPMPSIGHHCHELRIQDKTVLWRIMYFLDDDAIVILDVIGKKTQRTRQQIIDACRSRLRRYQNA
jgi:phage-related protein